MTELIAIVVVIVWVIGANVWIHTPKRKRKRDEFETLYQRNLKEFK